MEFKAHIENLVGAANWSKWKRQIELLLRHHNVHDVVCGDRECPRLPAEASAEAIAAYEKAQKAFVKDDSLAQLIRVGNMDDSNAELTSVCNTAKSVWEKLLSVYEQSSGQRLDRLMEKFFRSEKELEDDIASHIAKLQRNFSELNDELRRVAKTTLPDLLLMSRIMSTLPTEYFEFKSVWESVPIEERSVNKLTERLRLIEMRLPLKSTDTTALVATRKKVLKKPERKCYICRKPGHLAKDFWKKGSKPKVEGDAFVCTVEDVCGPMQQQSLGSAKYYVCFKDDFTKYRRVFFMHSKNEVSKCPESFLNEAKNTRHMIKEVLSDGGGEVINSTVKSLLEKSGISSQHIEPETYKEAMASEDSDKCFAAMKEELESLSNNNTWILVNLPSDSKAIGIQGETKC
ncbi:retrovirus-related Pol polyprotein from transposon TNT 1-94 [Trichonephila clavata]|uniref:Retrovirus-related Pol polyprotein from transposon TNT 1-94 n=1 Tax=Trichonephila clavata TaxID=2740835 RepID=A0A8X6M2D8_TRICU|nr:retrovirus-related Pol polyprotein from transposon TNT 1-94 [Trichonephila clavata]